MLQKVSFSFQAAFKSDNYEVSEMTEIFNINLLSDADDTIPFQGNYNDVHLILKKRSHYNDHSYVLFEFLNSNYLYFRRCQIIGCGM